MKIVIAPDSFKESLPAIEVCEAIASGLRSVFPDAVYDLCPMADGGEGTVDALVASTAGRHITTIVRAPLGDTISARWGILPDGTAVIEMAAASGLPLVPTDQRNPMKTGTFGTGQLIRAALDHGCTRIILGIGGSATNDGGIGCGQALGVRFLDPSGTPLPEPANGGMLGAIARIDMTDLDPRVHHTDIRLACDVDNPLCGPRGASAIFGPQKGATPDMVAMLDQNLARLGDIIRRDLEKDVLSLPGGGAAGGLGAGLSAFCNATIQPGIELMMRAARLSERLQDADLLITGEGRLDRQSMMGKVIAGVGRAGKSAGVPVIALVGSIGEGAEESSEVLDAYFSIMDRPMGLQEAISNADALLTQTARQIGRLLRLRTPQ